MVSLAPRKQTRTRPYFAMSFAPRNAVPHLTFTRNCHSKEDMFCPLERILDFTRGCPALFSPPFSQAPPNKRIECPNDDQEALRVAKVYQQHLMSLRLLCLPVTPSTSHHVLLPLPANELTLIATMSPSHSSPSQLVSLSSAQIQHCAII
jgi:hypothetical protein